MPQARPLLFGALLLALALPGHPLAPLSGLPLDLPALCLVVLIAAWWIAFTGAPPRTGALVSGLVALAMLKATIWWAAPAYGLTGEIRPIETATVDLPGAPPYRRGTDLALDFEGDT